MSGRKKLEVFTADCGFCNEQVERIRKQTESCCELQVLDVGNPEVATRAAGLGVRALPALFVEGEPAESCC